MATREQFNRLIRKSGKLGINRENEREEETCAHSDRSAESVILIPDQ